MADRSAPRCRCGRRHGATIAAAATNDDAADVSDLELILAALVGARLPPEKRRVERGGFLVVRRLERDVIEPHGLPRRRFERHRRRGLAGGGSLTPVLPNAVADL